MNSSILLGKGVSSERKAHSLLANQQENSKPRRIDRILVVLSDLERRHFFPDEMWTQLVALADEFIFVSSENLLPEKWEELLFQHHPQVLLSCWSTPALPERLPSSLKYVCYLVGSVRHCVTARQIAMGLKVSNWGNSISRTVAEWALFHVIGCLRQAAHWSRVMQQEGGWKTKNLQTASLFQKRVGLHGFGSIAREFIQLLKPFDVKISVFAPDVDSHAEKTACNSLEELFSQNDVVVELAPLTVETAGIVTESLLRKIRPGGVFVNVARGGIVNEDALLRVAAEGRIQIGLDTYHREPLLQDSPLRSMRNVLLTPHISGPTVDRRQDAGLFALENLRRYVSDLPLLAQVTPNVYEHLSQEL